MRARGVGLSTLIALFLALAAAPAGAAISGPGWQNPQLALNPASNIHNDSFLSDNYADLGPLGGGRATVDQIGRVSFVDPLSGQQRTKLLGECAAHTFDGDGNMVTLCTGVPLPSGDGRWTFDRSIVTLDRGGRVLAYASFPSTYPDLEQALSDFGGAGYFYLDNRSRPVVAMPDGSVVVFGRADSALSPVDAWAPVRSVQVGGEGGPLQGRQLYALMPAPDGAIWFTTADGVAGTVAPDDSVHWVDLNARPGGGEERIANSHAIGPDGSAYVLSTHRLYRIKAGPSGQPRVVWSARYDRGRGRKPGQVSWGSGTSPTLFGIGRETYVAIADNARRMNVVVYRTRARLAPGQRRLFAQVKPFGDRVRVSDENSLVWAPAAGGGANLFAENNWGNETLASTAGGRVTQPGVARLLLRPDGSFTVASRNDRVAVPSVVSKASQRSGLLYTYEKRRSGWYLTALDQRDLRQVAFRVRIGDGSARNNNYYAALSLDPDGRTVWIGTSLGLTRVVP